MSTLIDKASTASVQEGHIVIRMESGTEIRFPVNLNPRLAKASITQLVKMEISPYGIHWPELDEDLSFRGILEGDYGQNLKG